MKTIIWINLISFLIISYTACFLSCDQPTNTEDINDPINNYKVYLTGKVLDKDGNPVPFVIAHLKKNAVLDTTDTNGIYEVTVDLNNLTKTENTVADTSDTLQILKDGQIITTFEIINFIDTLPDVMIVQPNIGGTIASTVTQFSKIEAVVWNHSDIIIKKVELEYSLPTFSYSGCMYFVYSGISQNYSVYVNVYSIDSLFIGRSDTITFSSVTGDIQIPVIDPQSAIPVPLASSADSSVSINDSLHLIGTASDRFGGIIAKWEWDAGNTGTFVETTPDSSFTAIAPATANSAYPCVLKVTDNDGNVALDTVTINVVADLPIPTASTSTPTVSINDTIRLQGTATDVYGSIVKWEWDAGNTGTFVETTPDSSFTAIAPGSQSLNYQCVLKVTDNDSNVAKDTVAVTAYAGTVTDIDGNIYHTVAIGSQVWTVENLRTAKYNDGSAIPLVTDGVAWSSDTTPGYCYYDNTTSTDTIAKYGALYNWYTVNTGKLAPAGWHVTTDTEWMELENYLVANGYNWDGSTTGNKIGKATASQIDWSLSINEGAVGYDLSKNNRSGFNGLPGGYRGDDGFFLNFTYNGFWWSATVVPNTNDTQSYTRNLGSDYAPFFRGAYGKKFGFSVRLVQD